MAFKRYLSRISGDYTVFITLANKRQLKVKFNGKDIITKERFIDVEDPMVQQALEENEHFGSYFTLSEYAIEEQTAPSETSHADMTFPNLKEAKEWINSTHGVSYSKMLNRIQVIQQFELLGFTVTFLTD